MGKWCFLPYDFDTAIGINNEGTLAFSYELEDIDQVAGADVYNGQHSVLWTNLRQAYFDEIKAMYQDLRSKGKLSYEDTERRFEEHQAKWPEAIFNEDAWFKYLQPLIDDNSAAYLSMLQGSKAEQRKWWLYNRYRYLDSKYNAGDALSDVITVRGYAKADITVTPYADIYASVKYGSYLVQQRALRGKSYKLECPLDNVNDTEIYIYSASQLASVGDLSGLMVGYAEFSLATKLQSLKLGDSSASYRNTNLTGLHLGNNVLLRTLDVRNCPNLVQAVDISGCSNIEHVYFERTGITGLLLPVGGILKTLHLPATVTNLTIRNQASLSDLTMPSYANVSTLRLENVSNAVNSRAILQAIPANSRVRLIGIDWTLKSADDLMLLKALFDTMRGLDESGNNMEIAQVSGTIHVDTVTGAQVAEMQGTYPDVKIDYQHISSNLYFYSDDGSTLLYTAAVIDGGDGVYAGNAPSKASTAQYIYSFSGWSKKAGGTADVNALKTVVADRNVYAVFTAVVRKYTVKFYNGSNLLQTITNVAYGSSASYTGTTPTKTDVDNPEMYEFREWEPTGKNIIGNTNCYAQYNYLGAPTLFRRWYPGSSASMLAETNTFGDLSGYNGEGAFVEKSTITEINIVDSYLISGNEDAYWDASYYKNGSVMAYRSGTVVTLAKEGLETMVAQEDSSFLFSDMDKLTILNGLETLDTRNVTSMAYAFQNCKALTTLGLSKLDTSRVTNFIGMFYRCEKLINIPEIDTRNGTSFFNMFRSCSKIKSIPELDTGNGTNFNGMFGGCENLASIPYLNTSKGTSFESMFYQCRSIKEVKGLKTGLGGNLNNMFMYCSSLVTINPLNFTSATTFTNMFYSTGGYNLATVMFEGTLYENAADTISGLYFLNRESIATIVEALYDYSGSTTKTLKLSSKIVIQLTNEQKAVIAAKNWIISS